MPPVLRRPALDDRDREYTPAVLAEMALHAESQAARTAARDLQRALRRIVREETRRWSVERVSYGLVLGVAIGVVAMVVLTVVGAAFGGGASLIAFLVVVAFAMSLERAAARRRIGGAVGATITAHGFCGACGYSLRGLAAEGDGCLVCPECGGAWRAGRITRAHWEAPRRTLAPLQPLALRAILVRPPVVPDHRGMLCRRLDSWLLTIPRERRREIGRGRVAEMRREIRRPSLWIRAVLAALLLAPLLWMLTMTPTADGGTGGATLGALWTAWAALAILLALAVAAALTGEIGVRSRRVAAACVSRSLCAACGSDLRGPEADGFAVCPACGASWMRHEPADPGMAPRAG